MCGLILFLFDISVNSRPESFSLTEMNGDASSREEEALWPKDVTVLK